MLRVSDRGLRLRAAASKMMCRCVLVILMLRPFEAGSAQATRFQCQSSSNDNELIYTPNIPDFYFNDSNAAANFRTDGSANLTQSLFRRVAYIFTIPQSQLHNYSGTVVSLQYCYQATNNSINNNRTINVFAFLLLTQIENGMNFTVNKQIFIGSTPSKSICTVPSGSIQQICCDTTTLKMMDQFQLPSNFSFGVVILNPNVRPLAITTSSTRTEYHVEQYVTLVGLTNRGTMFTLASNEKVNDHTLLFRFSIGSGSGSIPPIIPDFYFNDSNAAANFRTDGSANLTQSQFRRLSYIFAIPPESPLRNCSGTVVSLQYCYQARNSDIGRNRTVFIFLSLTQNGMNFTVNRRIFIRTTPSNTICTNSSGSIQQICCDTTTLNINNQFQLPSSNFSFGVAINNPNVRPLAFTTSSTEYHVEQYKASLMLTNSGTMFTLSTSEKVNDSFLLFRFVIEPAIATTEQPTVTTQQGTTLPPTVTYSETMTPFTGQSPPEVGTTAITNGSGSQISGAAIGGAVGGCVIVLLMIASVACVVIVLVKRQPKQIPDIQERDGMTIQNAIYDGVDSESNGTKGFNITQPTYMSNDYAGIGPQVSDINYKCKDVQEESNEYYADCGATYDLPSLSTENPEQQPSTWKDEDIYMVPAEDEGELYSQLKDILIKNLVRDSVKLGDQLGSGQFGVVYKGVLRSPKLGEVDVAVKTLKEGSGEEDRVKFLQEAAIMGQFKHHNVVTMHGVVTDGEPILLILELLTKGDLRGHLLKAKSNEGGAIGVDDHTLLSYCRQVAYGMAYLSNKAFVHRDLAARNILVSEDEICKIADFGMSRDLMNESYYVSHGGQIPVKWTAPEALYYKKYSSASDVWSFGALMYEIWSVGHKPYEDYANNEVLKLIDTGFRLPPPPGCPRTLYSIMISCWSPVPSQRPNFSDISRQLSLPDTKLLQWSEEDRAVHPEATKLGADLLCGQELYKDLQTQYRRGN